MPGPEIRELTRNTDDGEVDFRLAQDTVRVFLINLSARDVAATARAIPSTSGDQRWNADADANGDGVINVADLRLAIESFLDPACR